MHLILENGVNNMILKKIIGILIIFSFLIPQQIYEFTEEQVQTLYSQIQTLEYADSTNQKMIEKKHKKKIPNWIWAGSKQLE